jgi:hypothetical protein
MKAVNEDELKYNIIIIFFIKCKDKKTNKIQFFHCENFERIDDDERKVSD